MTTPSPGTPRVPTPADNAYFELVGARIHTSDLADEVGRSESFTAAGLDRIVDVAARLLDDLDRLWVVLPLSGAQAGLREPLSAVTAAFRETARQHGASAASTESAPLTVQEIEQHRELAAREWAAAYYAEKAADLGQDEEPARDVDGDL